MVKDVVKSEYRMIDMWSSFWGGRSARKLLHRWKKRMESREETYRSLHVVNLLNRNDNYVVRQSREYLHPSSAGVVL